MVIIVILIGGIAAVLVWQRLKGVSSPFMSRSWDSHASCQICGRERYGGNTCGCFSLISLVSEYSSLSGGLKFLIIEILVKRNFFKKCSYRIADAIRRKMSVDSRMLLWRARLSPMIIIYDTYQLHDSLWYPPQSFCTIVLYCVVLSWSLDSYVQARTSGADGPC